MKKELVKYENKETDENCIHISTNVKRKFSCQIQINTEIENNEKFQYEEKFYLNLYKACVLVCSNWMILQEI